MHTMDISLANETETCDTLDTIFLEHHHGVSQSNSQFCEISNPWSSSTTRLLQSDQPLSQ